MRPPLPPLERRLQISDIAYIYRTGRSSVYRWIAGVSVPVALPMIKVGRNWSISYDMLLKWEEAVRHAQTQRLGLSDITRSPADRRRTAALIAAHRNDYNTLLELARGKREAPDKAA